MNNYSDYSDYSDYSNYYDYYDCADAQAARPHIQTPWINVISSNRKNRHQTSIKLDYPLDYPGQTTSKQFSNWCNQMAKDNPTIFVNIPANAYHANMILDSIYKTTPLLHRSNCETIIRKMQARFILSGFPLTIKTKCLAGDCNRYVSVTSKYTQFLCQYFVKPKHIVHACCPRQLFCIECKNKEKLRLEYATQYDQQHMGLGGQSTDDLADFFSAIQISNNYSAQADTMME